MKERPIIFSGEMVRAILDGRKTMTRRVITPQFSQKWGSGVPNERTFSLMSGGQRWKDAYGVHVDIHATEAGHWLWVFCPYGKPGDRLWVRETFLDCLFDRSDAERASREDVYYRADGDAVQQFPEEHMDVKWRPSIFMPRWASRITLEITNVRVERLRDISEIDCEIELGTHPYSLGDNAYNEFQKLWDKINGKKHPWSSNPWVWVIEFKKI